MEVERNNFIQKNKVKIKENTLLQERGEENYIVKEGGRKGEPAVKL